jgi:CheY-like chemotaxis protein
MMDQNESAAPIGLLLCDDLMFSSRITGTARGLGLSFKVARSGAELQSLAAQQTPPCVLIDLSNPGLSIADVVASLGPEGNPRPFLVAYGSHVDAATLRAAREAGCDLVLPRSKFVEELPTALPRWFAGNA